MVIRESNDGHEYTVCINLSANNGDRVRLVERNNDENDIPVLICYNLGQDFNLQVEGEKRNRVLVLLKMFRIAVNEAMKDISGEVGGKPTAIVPHDTREAAGQGFGGKMVQGRRKRNYQVGGSEIVTSANIPARSIESSWRVVKLGPRGGRPPCPGGLPG